MPAATSAKWPFLSSLLPVRLTTQVRLAGVHEPCPFSGWTLRVWLVAVCVFALSTECAPSHPEHYSTKMLVLALSCGMNGWGQALA